jgi:hypothetical protein
VITYRYGPRAAAHMKAVPYASAASGANARDEITKVLCRFGCESVGFMDDFEKHEVLLAFAHRARQIQLRASAKGWAQMFLKAEPWSHRRRGSRIDYEQAALRQATPPSIPSCATGSRAR